MPASSRASEGPTLGLNVPDGTPSASPRLTPMPAPSSPSDGRESPTSETSLRWLVARAGGDFDNPTYTMDDQAMLAANPMSDRQMMVVGPLPDSGPAGFLARTSRSPGSDRDSPESDPASPSPSSTLWSATDLPPSSSKTYRASSPVIEGETWRRSAVDWRNSGTGGRFGFSTLATSECPSADDGSSSSVCAAIPTTLTDVLQPSTPPRFSLSARAARGILRRASKRGLVLPEKLEQALTSLARFPAPVGSDTTMTQTPSSPERSLDLLPTEGGQDR